MCPREVNTDGSALLRKARPTLMPAVCRLCVVFAPKKGSQVVTLNCGHTKCLEYVWNMDGICMEHAWNTYRIHMEYVWNMRGWDMHGICMKFV